MNTADPGPGAAGSRPAEYRAARLQERLAAGPYAELALRIEFRGDAVLVRAVAGSPACRSYLLDAVAEEFTGLRVHTDIALADTGVPDHPEAVQ
ncbi:hypothetical protein [Kitasatospora sp. DSM 101779]|uniref:hypothetical protein n=1 Tax=Kitasatospora sp. DSM 101779 TaxID=2853165 RepID=UPI0021DA76C8|nr:hypothetical protein [Kitasatospora sp. DSM 101779]MCU7826809.1 hypothetical protein [Kitasatospora sp. DSM 101779]